MYLSYDQYILIYQQKYPYIYVIYYVIYYKCAMFFKDKNIFKICIL